MNMDLCGSASICARLIHRRGEIALEVDETIIAGKDSSLSLLIALPGDFESSGSSSSSIRMTNKLPIHASCARLNEPRR
jgi:hypothetical protein